MIKYENDKRYLLQPYTVTVSIDFPRYDVSTLGSSHSSFIPGPAHITLEVGMPLDNKWDFKESDFKEMKELTWITNLKGNECVIRGYITNLSSSIDVYGQTTIDFKVRGTPIFWFLDQWTKIEKEYLDLAE